MRPKICNQLQILKLKIRAPNRVKIAAEPFYARMTGLTGSNSLRRGLILKTVMARAPRAGVCSVQTKLLHRGVAL